MLRFILSTTASSSKTWTGWYIIHLLFLGGASCFPVQWKNYPGCQRLFMRGFLFRSSLKKWPVFSRNFAAHFFGLWPNTFRPAAGGRQNGAPRRTREKTSGTQVMEERTLFKIYAWRTCLYANTDVECGSNIVGFHMTSSKFKLQNYRSYWDFTFMVY